MNKEEQLHSLVDFYKSRGIKYSESVTKAIADVKLIQSENMDETDKERLFHYFYNILHEQTNTNSSQALTEAKSVIKSVKEAAIAMES